MAGVAAAPHARRSRSPTTLHVTNGESAASSLRAALGGRVVSWADALHVGPVPGGLAPARLRAARARFLAGLSGISLQDVSRGLAERDRTLDDHGGDYLLWFEADLYDQLQLIQILDALRRKQVRPDDIGLISVGEFRGVAHFMGLGQLTPRQLKSLQTERVTLTEETLALASRAWAALRRADPSGLMVVARSESAQLRFLAEAFGRLMQEYPSRVDGLSLTERRILIAVSEGAETAGEALKRVNQRERRPFLGDLVCYALIQELATAPRPLLKADVGDRPRRETALGLTRVGRQVLEGRADHCRLNGCDRWIGGVHLSTGVPGWRYDERLETLVQVAG